MYIDHLDRYDNTCGFWTIGMALFKILDIDFSHLPMDAGRLQHCCSVLWKEYQSSPAGGLTCELVQKIIQEFNEDFSLSRLQGKNVVSGLLLNCDK